MNDQPNQRKNWHEALTTLQTARIRKVHAAIGRGVLGLFEHFEAGFLQELYIDEAITDYEKIAHAFIVWKSVYPEADIRDQKWVLNHMIRKRSCQN
jgi:hypothetical protein